MSEDEKLMDYERRMKPERLKNQISRQHQQWQEVMVKQLDENYARHVKQVKRNGGRTV